MTNSVTPILSVNNLSMTFPNGNGGLKALAGLNFSIDPQEFICVLGPSGSGKSTLLRVLAGLLQPTDGTFQFNLPDSDSSMPRIGLVFQQANLMPWRDVIGNIMLPLELHGVEKTKAYTLAKEWIELVGLGGFEHEWPRNLSGGMAQRVAIVRALIQDPDLLLLDEPFGSLDALTRERMGSELLRLWMVRRKTVLMVTHSIAEAILLSDRVIVLTNRPGRIALDMPVDLPRPRDEELRYTREFGEMVNRLRIAIGEV